MRNAHFFATFLALSACGPAETQPREYLEQVAALTTSVYVPSGPVTVPLLPSVASPLISGQILCDAYKVDVRRDDDVDDGDRHADHSDVYAQCVKTANSFYKEVQVQLSSLSNPRTVDRGLAAMNARTTFLFPDGSITQGADAFKNSYSDLFDSGIVVGIQNKFIYKPIDKDTVILIGDPTYSLRSGTTVDSVQYHVYVRQHKGEGSCRSLAKPSGKVCWSEVTGQWAYKQPFSGSSIPHAISSVRSQIPESTSFPSVLESSRIVCDGSFRARRGDALNCEQLAREFYKEVEYQVLTILNPSTVGSGLASVNDATTFVYPPGLVTEGLMGLLATLPQLFGENTLPVGVQNKFIYKPIDSETILFIGDPMFTMLNLVTGATKQLESVQVSVYRRNETPLANCRSLTNQTGDVCWSEIAEQWVYGQPMLGE